MFCLLSSSLLLLLHVCVHAACVCVCVCVCVFSFPYDQLHILGEADVIFFCKLNEHGMYPNIIL